MTTAEIGHAHLEARVDGLFVPQAKSDRPIAWS